jgi:hypothetical protein
VMFIYKIQGRPKASLVLYYLMAKS